MTAKQFKAYAIFSFVMGTIISTIVFYLNQLGFLVSLGLGSFSSLTIFTGFWGLVIRHGVKIKLLSKLFGTTNLNGTWHGEYISCGPDGEIKGDIILKIHQTLLNISVQSFTKNSWVNTSYCENLMYNENHDEFSLTYTYQKINGSELNMSSDNGTCTMRLSHYKSNLTLKGKYWMLDGKNGTIEVVFSTRKKATSYEYGMKLLEEGR